MSSVMYGLVVAVFWGCADIQCSLIPENSLRVAFIAQSVGLVALACIGIVTFGVSGILALLSFHLQTLVLLSGLGILSALAYVAMYRALQSAAPTGVVSAILSANGAVSVLASILVFHEYDGRLLLLLGIILSGVLLAARSQTRISQSTGGMLCAVTAMVALGGFNFGIGFVASTGTMDWFPLLFGTRACSLFFVVIAFSVSPGPRASRKRQGSVRSVLLASGTGLTEMVGLLLFSFAAHLHLDLALTSAIASCSSMVPLLASFLRDEPMQRDALRGCMLILFGLIGLFWTAVSPILIALLATGTLCILWLPQHTNRQDLSTIVLIRKVLKERAGTSWASACSWNMTREIIPIPRLDWHDIVCSLRGGNMIWTGGMTQIQCCLQSPRPPPYMHNTVRSQSCERVSIALKGVRYVSRSSTYPYSVSNASAHRRHDRTAHGHSCDLSDRGSNNETPFPVHPILTTYTRSNSH